MRPAVEPMAQRELVEELRFQVDHALAVPRDKTQSIARIQMLVRLHPIAMKSRHVIHNVGPRRMRLIKEWTE